MGECAKCITFNKKVITDLSDKELIQCYDYLLNNKNSSISKIKCVEDIMYERGLSDYIHNYFVESEY